MATPFCWYQIFLYPITLTFDLLLKTLTLAIEFEFFLEMQDFHIKHVYMYSWCQRLSTLTIVIRRDRVFVLHMCIHFGKTFGWYQTFNPMTLTFNFIFKTY